MKDFNYNNISILSDFDGTITLTDTINKFLDIFADKSWLSIEEQWKKGEIGSKICLQKQFDLIPKLTDFQINNFFDDIKIDESFLEFYSFIKKNNIPFAIVSDGFDFFIEKILEKNNLFGIKIYSNNLYIDNNGKCKVSFIQNNLSCNVKAANCKCQVLDLYKKSNNYVIYIGDGLSDICISGKVDILFAKNYLANYCKEKKIKHTEYNRFEDIRRIIARKGINYGEYSSENVIG